MSKIFPSATKDEGNLTAVSQNTFAKVSIYAHISRSACETLVFTVRNVLVGLCVDIFFGKAKVNDIDCFVFVGRMPTN